MTAVETTQVDSHGASALLGQVVGLSVLIVLSISFALALASIIYVGPLADFANRGIGMTLLGGAVMPLVAAALSSYKAIVFHIQDVPAVLLSIAAASIASSLPADAAFASVATMIAGTCIVTGVALWLGSVLKLGFLARYIPYSVIGGFLAATGMLLTTGALGMMTGESVSVLTPGSLFVPGAALHWAPWLIFGGALVCAIRRFDNPLVLPGAILAAVVLFYGVLAVSGISLEEAGARGLLVGPFEQGGFVDDLSLSILGEADWGAIRDQAPTILAVIAMSFIGVLLNTSGLEVAMGRDFDMEKELRAAGVANIAGGAFGGQIGFHLLGETLLGRKMGVRGWSAAVAVAGASLIVLIFGASLIGQLPIGVLAALIAMLGLDFLYEWLWARRAQLPVSDRALILLIVTVAATVGFLEAFFVGLLAASIFFITSYSQIDVVRMTTNAATRRSSVERQADAAARIAAKGERTLIYILSGYLFFGTAHRLLDRIRHDLESRRPGGDLIIDFSRVSGLDSSAGFIVNRVAMIAERHGHGVTLAGLSPIWSAAGRKKRKPTRTYGYAPRSTPR